MCGTLIASETPKGREILRNCAVGLDRAVASGDVDEDGLQRVVEHAGDLQRGTEELVRRLSMSPQFADEERVSNYTYPPEYGGPKPITDQIGFLVKLLGLDPTSALVRANNLPELPNGAEGWFAIPSLAALAAKHFPTVADSAEQYCRAIQLVLGKLGELRAFCNYREGQITPDHLIRSARTAHMLGQISEVQKSDILIIAAQLGLRHRGKSVRRAREVFTPDEFGLGSLEGGSIVLTHPERLVRWEQLHMDCAGDEFLEAAGMSVAPCLYYSGGKVKFVTHWVVHPYGNYGSASGFLPAVSSSLSS